MATLQVIEDLQVNLEEPTAVIVDQPTTTLYLAEGVHPFETVLSAPVGGPTAWDRQQPSESAGSVVPVGGPAGWLWRAARHADVVQDGTPAGWLWARYLNVQNDILSEIAALDIASTQLSLVEDLTGSRLELIAIDSPIVVLAVIEDVSGNRAEAGVVDQF